MRLPTIFAALVGLALMGAAEQPAPLVLQGEPTQGGLVRGTAAPGAQVFLSGEPIQVGADGAFVFGFDRNDTGNRTLRVVWPDGRQDVRTLTIAPREWEIQSITGLPPEQVTPPPETYDRIRREAAEKLAARKPDTQGSWFAESFTWPARGPVSGVYGSQRVLNGEPGNPHWGLDIAVPEGAQIVAPAGGVVTLAEPDMYFEGGLVFIDHGHGLISYLMHMSKVEATVGQVLKQGDEIGRVGHTGRATGAHVHWGMYWMKAHIDPQLLIPPVPPVAERSAP